MGDILDGPMTTQYLVKCESLRSSTVRLDQIGADWLHLRIPVQRSIFLGIAFKWSMMPAKAGCMASVARISLFDLCWTKSLAGDAVLGVQGDRNRNCLLAASEAAKYWTFGVL